IAKHTTIIRTRFEDFKKPKKCGEDIELMIKGGGELAEIIESCQKEVIHVNNPPITIAEAVYKPPKLQELSTEIVGYMESKKELEEELASRLQKKKLRKLRIKINAASKAKDDKDDKKNVSAENVDKSKSTASKEEKKQESANQEFGADNKVIQENINIQADIKQLEDERKKLKEQIQEKENIIREKVFKHIFNNYEEILNIPGGSIFISSIKDSKKMTAKETLNNDLGKLKNEYLRQLEKDK
ncbi:31589_t:CDS:2, partial [Racocetra persica]